MARFLARLIMSVSCYLVTYSIMVRISSTLSSRLGVAVPLKVRVDGRSAQIPVSVSPRTPEEEALPSNIHYGRMIRLIS